MIGRQRSGLTASKVAEVLKLSSSGYIRSRFHIKRLLKLQVYNSNKSLKFFGLSI